MSEYVGLKKGKVHESHIISEYYCGGCGWPVTDHDSYCPECGGALHEGDDKSQWHKLFGTPERAAGTLERAELEVYDYCAMVNSKCDECRYEGNDGYGCYDPAPLLEWLRGDA